MLQSEDGFIQSYDLGKRQELFIYCRMCRTVFAVVFKPKSRRVRLCCVCGHEGPLAQLDVFRTRVDADEHAAFYEKIYRAAKDALKDAGVPLPPSGKYERVDQALEDSQFESYYDSQEDISAIEDAYVELEESDASSNTVTAQLAVFDQRLAEADGPLEHHAILSELIEWSYVRRYKSPEIYRRFRDACDRDIALAAKVVRLAKQQLKRGLARGERKIRLSFASFKHLIIDLEETEKYAQAAQVAEEAAALGLKGYADRAARLRARAR